MIFTPTNNNGIPEFRGYVPKLDKNTDFEQLTPEIENAEFELRKIVGNEVMDFALEAYNRTLGEYGSIPTQTDYDIVAVVQGAVANMAFLDYTVGNDLRHSLTGRKASINPTNEKQAWEFSIDKDNEAMTYRVQKALNRLISFLDTEKLEAWTGSVTFKIKHSVLLSDIDIFSRFYPIENSLLLFNQLLPIQKEMQRKHIAPLLGKELLAAILANQADESSGAGYDNDQLTLLMDYAGPALALWTMATGIKRLSVKLLPEGLVQQFKSSVQSRNSSFNVNPREKDQIVASLLKDAEEATAMLENQLKIINAVVEDTTVTPITMLGERNLSTNKYFSV